MVHKTLLILASSFKGHARCIAGRELIAAAGEYELGPWIRPISAHGQGELDESDTACEGGAQINVRDYAEVTLLAPANNRFQPENWTIAGPECWRLLQVSRRTIKRGDLVESPRNLWFDPGEDRTDRILHARLILKPATQSLYVIRPDDLRLKFFTEFDAVKCKEVKKSRAVFVYNGMEYDMGLTDPVASAKYNAHFPAVGAPANVAGPSGKVAPLVCVSLIGDFNGFHYKVAATIIE